MTAGMITRVIYVVFLEAFKLFGVNSSEIP